MSQAHDFTRDDCLVGKKRRTYAALKREYVCNMDGGRLDTQWSDDTDKYPERWFIQCAVCGGQDFIHEREYVRQEYEAAEVLEGLPAELAAAMGYAPPPRRTPQEIVSILHPEPVEV